MIKSWWCLAETITDADYSDDVVHLVNTLRPSRITAAEPEDLWDHKNNLSRKTLKSVDQFTYFGNNISSTDSDVNILLVKSWCRIFF